MCPVGEKGSHGNARGETHSGKKRQLETGGSLDPPKVPEMENMAPSSRLL